MSMFDDLMGADERRTSILEAIYQRKLERKRDIAARLKDAITKATVKRQFTAQVIMSADIWDNSDMARVELCEMEDELKSLGYKVHVAMNHRPATAGRCGERGHAAQHLMTVGWQ